MEKSAGRERVVMVRRTSSKELCLISCGYEIGTKNQSFGPSVRDYYMIHFVTEGEGHYYLNHKHYRIRKGQCFLTVPGVSTLYHAEPENPWVYMWVCVSGSLAPRLLEQCRMNAGMPVLELPDMKKITNIIEEMMRHDELSPVDECTIQGSLYLLFAALLEQQRAAYSQMEQSDNRYVTKAVDFIGEHISGELLVEDVAEYLNVSRGHLYELFRRELGVSPQQRIYCSPAAQKYHGIKRFALIPRHSRSPYPRSHASPRKRTLSGHAVSQRSFSHRTGVGPAVKNIARCSGADWNLTVTSSKLEEAAGAADSKV
ncbi:AraC family transcriptional regulator [Lachnospiraceae bacterium MD308]|nr:AraC family transcriptional regulator [Lachnospiraceae bacterium MD308]